MKRFAMTVVLTCALSGSALAGDIPSVGVVPPPPAGTTVQTTPVDVPSVGLAQEMAEAALTFVELVLSAIV